jgi:hypothetical protein
VVDDRHHLLVDGRAHGGALPAGLRGGELVIDGQRVLIGPLRGLPLLRRLVGLGLF